MAKSDKTRIKGDSWTEEDYRRYLLGLMQNTCTADAYRRVRIGRNFDYYYGNHQDPGYTKLLTLHEAESTKGNTPFVRMNFNGIAPKVDYLVGLLRQMGFELTVTAHNREAVKRKQKFGNQLRFQMDNQPLLRRAAQMTGVPFGINENLPRTDKELKEEMKRYRDFYEILLEEAVRENIEVYKYEYLRKTLFLDCIIQNEVHCKNEIINGFPKWRRVNPFNCIYDILSESDFMVDSSFFAEVYYMPIPAAMEKFELEKETMEEYLEEYKQNSFDGFRGVFLDERVSSAGPAIFRPFEKRYGKWGGHDYDRVLIYDGEWLDAEIETQKVTHDPHGNPHVHNFLGKAKGLTSKEKADPKNNLESKALQVVRRGVIIGGTHLTNFGIARNQLRDFDQPEVSRLNYVSLVRNWNNQETSSLVDRLAELEEFKNYVLTVMQKEITANVGNVVAIDTSKIDPRVYGTGRKAMMNLLQTAKAYKIVLYNSQKAGIPDQAKPLSSLNLSMQAIIQESLAVAAYIEEQEDRISGVTAQRMGQVGERTLASTHRMAQSNASLVTDSLFFDFQGFEEILFEKHIMQLAMVWAHNPERYKHIADRLGIVLPEDVGTDLQKYRAHVRTSPISREMLNKAAEGALAQGNLMFDEYLEVMMLANENLKRGIMEYLQRVEERREQNMKMRQQEMQIASKQQAEKDMRDTQGEMAKIDRQGQWKVQATQTNADSIERVGKLNVAQKDRQTKAKQLIEQLRENGRK